MIDKKSLPPVLDACCGSRMFWFYRDDKRALFIDNRTGVGIQDVGTPGTQGRRPCVIDPDMVVDFTQMPFPDEAFYHVVFDPPHCEEKLGKTSQLAFKYGILGSDWREMLRRGFIECFRVLKPGGTLVFKWCDVEMPLREVLALTQEKPMYGHRSGKAARTHWVVFFKCPTDRL